jgi:phosphoenolpyruvate carboxykinase (GTP)
VPRPDALDLSGLDIAEATIAELLSVDTAAWRTEASEIARYFDGYGSRLPARLKQEVEELNTRLARA